MLLPHNRRYFACLMLVALAALGVTACGSAAQEHGRDPSGNGSARSRIDRKVLLIGVSAITWEDVSRANSPAFDALVREGAVANVSIRQSNNPSESYAMLGASERVVADVSSGWAFDADEAVENGPAADLYRRRSSGHPRGAVLVPNIAALMQRNSGRNFDATVGLLGQRLEDAGMRTAVIGNADSSPGPLPRRLPSLDAPFSLDSGIHRQGALAVMRNDGTVSSGSVSRDLLEPSPSSPFGIATSQSRVLETFRQVWPSSSLVLVETGDTARADAYTLGAPRPQREQALDSALRRAGSLIDALLEEVDRSETLVIILAPTTPGGIEERGQLRPVIVSGPGFGSGVLTSPSTRHPGLVWLPDISATIGRFLGISSDRLAGGRPVGTEEAREERLDDLASRNRRAAVHDHLRAPISIVIISAQLLVYLIAIIMLRRGPLPRWMLFLLASALAFPIASFTTRTGVWRLGEWASAAAVVLAGFLVGGAAMTVRRVIHPALLITALTTAFFLVDLLSGAELQLDSIFGNSSVPAGRFFGIGNLGFALFSASALLTAGTFSNKRSRAWGVAVLVVATFAIGHPSFGADVGGTLALVCGLVYFAAWGKLPRRYLPLVFVGAVGVAAAFGVIDLLRPVSRRSHLGDFLASITSDPSGLWLVLTRKLTTALSLSISTRWALAVPGAIAVLVILHRRSPHRLPELLGSEPGLSAGLNALIITAIVGSLLNDSGFAVAGMMLAVATPWALLTVSRLQDEKVLPLAQGS